MMRLIALNGLTLITIALYGCGGQGGSGVGDDSGNPSGLAESSVASNSSLSSTSSTAPTTTPITTTANFAPSPTQRQASRFCGVVESGDSANAPNSFTFEQAFIENQLADGGLRGTVHGVTSVNQQYVFTYRSADNFFNSEQFNLVPANGQIAGQLAALKRHDAVQIEGTLLMTGAGPRHLLTTSVNVLQAYGTAYDYSYTVDETAFADFERATVFGKVHAILPSSEGLASGGVAGLVVEYQDMLLPVIVDPSHQDQVSQLYRDDIITLELIIERAPNRPLHFRTDPVAQASIGVVDSMVACHQQAATLTGELVRFPPSPVISREVFAVRVTDANGIARNYTFFPGVGFADPNFTALFNDISQAAASAWQAGASASGTNNSASGTINTGSANNTNNKIVDGRNYFVNPSIRVNVSGLINVTSPNQANPQITISDSEQLTFTTEVSDLNN